jgi:hypothetical protein
VAELGISSQLDEVEDLNVDIRTDPGKLIQGQVDSVTVEGKGMVMQGDLRVETLEVNTSTVAINPLGVMFGNLELTQPADAEAQIVLTQEDINRAFNSDFIQEKLYGLKLEVDGKPVTIDVQRAIMELPGDNKMVIDTDFKIRETGETKKLFAICVPRVTANGHRINLEILEAKGEGLTPEFAGAIIDQLTTLLDLRNFDLPGMTLQLHRLEPQQGRLVLHAATTIEQIPLA